MALLEKNQIIELEITATGSSGEGIGRYDGMVVFVPAAAVGDVLSVRIIKVQKTMAFGRLEQVVTPSPVRIEPDCETYPGCGGCSCRHISYEAEQAAKAQHVLDTIKRIGGVDVQLDRFVAAEHIEGYRNKAQLPCARMKDGRIRFGYFARHSHRVVGCEGCRLQPASFEGIIHAVAKYMEQYHVEPYNEETHSGLVRNLYLRRSRANGETVVCLVINGASLPDETKLAELVRAACNDVCGVIININTRKTNVILGEHCRTIWGKDSVNDTLLGVQFKISPLSFFQVNPEQTERLYSIAAEYADLHGGETLLDMYCGAGTIGLTMAKKAGKLIGVEVIAPAVEDAKRCAALNGIDNARFICADASDAANRLKQEGTAPDVVVLDPPRKGCDESLLKIIHDMDPKRIVYVSCDPATLARDIKRFAAMGIVPQKISAVDMFPRTSHVETVCLMSRKDK